MNQIFYLLVSSLLLVFLAATKVCSIENNYLIKLAERVKTHWQIPNSYSNNAHKMPNNFEANVVFKIESDGRISNIRLDKSTKHADYDIAITRAIQNSAPFEEPGFIMIKTSYDGSENKKVIAEWIESNTHKRPVSK